MTRYRVLLEGADQIVQELNGQAALLDSVAQREKHLGARLSALHGADSSQALNADLNVANSLGAAGANEAEAIFKNVLEVKGSITVLQRSHLEIENS